MERTESFAMKVEEQVWPKAMAKVEAQQVKPTLVERKLTAHDSVVRHYLVPSATSDTAYAVLVEQEQAGEVSVFCLCKAGLNDRLCWHAAVALLASGHLKPEPTPEVRRRGRAAIALLNDDMDTYEELTRSA
jgi:hypothetical protein